VLIPYTLIWALIPAHKILNYKFHISMNFFGFSYRPQLHQKTHVLIISRFCARKATRHLKIFRQSATLLFEIHVFSATSGYWGVASGRDGNNALKWLSIIGDLTSYDRLSLQPRQISNLPTTEYTVCFVDQDSRYITVD